MKLKGGAKKNGIFLLPDVSGQWIQFKSYITLLSDASVNAVHTQLLKSTLRAFSKTSAFNYYLTIY